MASGARALSPSRCCPPHPAATMESLQSAAAQAAVSCRAESGPKLPELLYEHTRSLSLVQ